MSCECNKQPTQTIKNSKFEKLSLNTQEELKNN